jgi:predicted nucleic acid-binding protein
LTSAVDTSVISAIWTDQPGTEMADALLDESRRHGVLMISGIVFAELLAHPGTNAGFAEDFFEKAGIDIDYTTDRAIWREAGLRYRAYGVRRRKAKHASPCRMLADFVIGAHALLRADRLITFNGADFRRDFPELRIAPEKSSRPV